MDSQLDSFNQAIANYGSQLSVSRGDIEAQLNERASELKERGQALLEAFVPAEALAKYGFDTAGVGLSDIPDLAIGAYNNISNIADSVLQAGGQIGQKIVSGYNTLVDGFSGGDTSIRGLADSLTRPLAQGEPESIELSNMAASDAVSSAIPGVEGVSEGVASSGLDIAAGAATNLAASVGTDAAAAGLEAVGAAADSTGIGAIIGVPLGIVGALVGGYSLYKGIEDLFSSHSNSDSIGAMMPNIQTPEFQAS